MTEKTGWPPGLLQDDDKKLSQWLASRPDARRVVREVCREIEYQRSAQQAADRQGFEPFDYTERS